MALRIKHKDAHVPDIREIKDGRRSLLIISESYIIAFSVIGRAEEEFHGCIC